MIRRGLYLIIATVVLGGLAALIAWYSFSFKPKMLAEAIGGAPQPAQTIAAEPARTDSWQPRISGIGTLTAVDGINITPEAGGVVERIEFDSGQSVKEGQLLVTLNSDTEQAELRSSEAQLVNAEADFKRRDSLAAKGLVPKAEIGLLRSRRDSFQADVDRLRATIARKKIYAPWEGTLGLREISLGSYVAPGQKIVWLQKIDPIFADFTVTEADYGRIKPGLPVEARFNAWPDQVFTGKVETADPLVSGQSRMITVRARIDNPDKKLLPGMYADVLIETGAPEQVVTVPQTAVTYSLYGDNLFVVVPASKVDPKAKPEELAIERRFVKAGQAREGRVQILSGVKEGEQVVTAGQNKIDQGSKVTINNAVALKATASETVQ